MYLAYEVALLFDGVSNATMEVIVHVLRVSTDFHEMFGATDVSIFLQAYISG